MKKARDMTEAASRAKSEFLANMSHELRTPLNAILGFSQIQLTHPDFPASMREGASIIKNSGEHLLTLITDILDISRIEAGKLELVRREIRLPWFIDNIEAIIAVRAREKGISFSVEKKGDSPEYIEADETRLRQVLLNLLGNAVKFTEKGYVRLRVESGMREGGKSALIRFEIKDSGVGIAEDQMDTVFQPFEQAGEVRFKSAGAGLGLPISRELVQLMGGELRVASVPGKGSTFQFQLRLPVLHGQAAAPREPSEAIVGYSGPARRILVVDDKMENRLALAGMLSPLGFEVIQAGGGREGVELAASASIDLVIMDLIMPDLDGMAATRRIR
ncbi:MAG: response regulator, partial [Desulfobacterales bacterium]|nr:response regulator [Desulfobacterales bacterium]